MVLFGHHMGIEIMGREFTPETPLEHAVAFGLTAVVLGLMAYGAIALVRDLLRWRRRKAEV